ncbi:MAG: hypothetical protein JNG84_14710, partial [Archangium sp.]|nr:hypothetical protein [Archangium sp.]
SQGHRDAWATAVSDRLLVLVWVGNHDWRRMHLASGATAAAPAVHRIMETEMARHRPWQPVTAAFAAPRDAVHVEVCALSGRRPGPGCPHVKSEMFLPGTEPHESCPFHAPVKLDARTGLRAGPGCPASVVQTKQLLALPEVYAPWARQQKLAIAPTAESPLCPTTAPAQRAIRIRTPAPASRYLYDPDTPREFSTLQLSAEVQPATEDVVWLVDGEVVARVGYPHEASWPVTRGSHVIRAQLARGGELSPAVRITVSD